MELLILLDGYGLGIVLNDGNPHSAMQPKAMVAAFLVELKVVVRHRVCCKAKRTTDEELRDQANHSEHEMATDYF